MNGALFFGALFGLGALIALTGQPHGRPRRSLQSRLESLSPENKPAEHAPRARVFHTKLFEEVLRPALERVGTAITTLTSRTGFNLAETSARLRMTGDEGGLPLFLGQKIASGFIGLALLPIANSMVATLPRSPWISIGMGLAGFFAPDLRLRAKSEARRLELREGMARFADLLALSVSAGLGLESAIDEALRASTGAFFEEFRRYLREARLNNESSSDALARLGDDFQLQDAEPLATALATAESQGIPVMQVLRAQARAIREKRRLELIEAGERAQVRMVLPVGLLILPAFFIVVLYPAAVQLLQITAR